MLQTIRRTWFNIPKPYLPFIHFYFAWFDMWIGAYYSIEGETLYIQLVPMLGVKIHVWRLKHMRSLYAGKCATCRRPLWLTCTADCNDIPF